MNAFFIIGSGFQWKKELLIFLKEFHLKSKAIIWP